MTPEVGGRKFFFKIGSRPDLPPSTYARAAPIEKLEIVDMKSSQTTHQRPPPHLSPSARQWWANVTETYVLEPHHLRLLQLACESWDRVQQAREQLATDGLTISGREGGIRPHPCVSIERDAKLGFARLVRELDLDTEPLRPDRIGPPALLSNRRLVHAREAPHREGPSARDHAGNSRDVLKS